MLTWMLTMAMIFGQNPAPKPKVDIDALLGSGRTDLVFKMGGKRKAILFQKKKLALSGLHNELETEFNKNEDTILYFGDFPGAWEMSNYEIGCIGPPMSQSVLTITQHSSQPNTRNSTGPYYASRTAN